MKQLKLSEKCKKKIKKYLTLIASCGGNARAKSLTPKRRLQISQMGVKAKAKKRRLTRL